MSCTVSSATKLGALGMVSFAALFRHTENLPAFGTWRLLIFDSEDETPHFHTATCAPNSPFLPLFTIFLT